jgi:Ca2+-binding EF-hand superfamily protein
MQRIKLNEIQLRVLVFMINVIIRLPNEVGLMKVFNRIDYREDGEIDEGEVRTALVSFLAMPGKNAEQLARELIGRIDLDSSGFINFTGTVRMMQSSWWLLPTYARSSRPPTSSKPSTSSTPTTAEGYRCRK